MSIGLLTNSLSLLSRGNTIDGREIENLIEEIEVDFRYDDQGEIRSDWEDDSEIGREYTALLDVREEVQNYSEDDLRDVTLFRDDYFPKYAEQFADDIGVINQNRGESTPWPLMHIDWDAAAEDLKQDYSSVEIDGVDFWFR